MYKIEYDNSNSDKCDLYLDKECNNCGECLKLDEKKYRSVTLSEVGDETILEEDFIEEDILLDKELAEKENFSEVIEEDGEEWILFEDFDEFSDLLDKEDLSTYEEYPGLIRLKSK